LDAYTFSVAGSVGLQLCEIWDWFEGTKTDRDLALGYGRGLQSINILINSAEDSQRGVTFYPKNWSEEDMIKYCTNNLKYAK
jgi:farnesyl-diphosphate farnesyltransferase